MDDETWRAALERYLAGESPPAERQRIEAWLQGDPARQAYLASLRTIGETWAKARPTFDTRAAWRRMAARVTRDAARVPERRRWDRGVRRRLAAVAAGALAAAAIGAAIIGGRAALDTLERSAPTPPAREYATAAGQQMSLSLPDGTRVWIAPGSRFVVDGDYGHALRTVRLVGQAYFEVTHDAARPFRVIAGNTVAWDLGTRFAVRAYPQDPVQVAVEEGSVAIPQALQAPLLPGDLATVDASGRGTVARGADLARYTAWTKGVLEFRDTPLGEAVKDLARWYGVDVRLGDPALASRHITVTVAESTPDAALDLIAAALGVRSERRGQTFVLRPATLSPRP